MFRSLMRAKDFPRLLFDTIHEAVGSPSLEIWPAYEPWQYFALAHEQKPLGYIGWKEGDGLHGKVTTLGVWGDELQDYARYGKEKEILDPLLKISGGAREAGLWVARQGNLLIEKVTVHPSCAFYSHGLDLRLLVIKLMAAVIGLAHQLAHETPPTSLSYWEAFRHPDRKYTKP